MRLPRPDRIPKALTSRMPPAIRACPSNPETPGKPGASLVRRAAEVECRALAIESAGARRRRGSRASRLAYQKAAPYIAASTSLVAAVGVFTGVGIWLDRKYATTPWLTLLGVVVGMTGGFISFFRTVLAKR